MTELKKKDYPKTKLKKIKSTLENTYHDDERLYKKSEHCSLCWGLLIGEEQLFRNNELIHDRCLDSYVEELKNYRQYRVGNSSRAEEYVTSKLLKKGIYFRKEETYEGLKHKKELRYDYYCHYEGYKFLIELDGVQHFYVNETSHWTPLEETQKKDLIKNKWALDHNISLLRVDMSYQKQEKNKKNFDKALDLMLTELRKNRENSFILFCGNRYPYYEREELCFVVDNVYDLEDRKKNKYELFTDNIVKENESLRYEASGQKLFSMIGARPTNKVRNVDVYIKNDRISLLNKTFSDREKNAIGKIKEAYPNFEILNTKSYIDEWATSSEKNSIITVECEICNIEDKLDTKNVRRKEYKIYCKNCHNLRDKPKIKKKVKEEFLKMLENQTEFKIYDNKELLFLKKFDDSQDSNYNTQREVAVHLVNGHNVFISGVAGAGKTFVVKEYIKLLKNTQKKFEVCAYAGKAAELLGGKTFNSLFKLETSKASYVQRRNANKINPSLIENLEVLIVDEISMISNGYFKVMIDMLANHNENFKNNNFQLIVLGDFSQLGPINDSKKDGFDKDYSALCYGTEYWEKMDFIELYLDKSQRSSDPELSKALKLMSDGKSKEAEDIIMKHANLYNKKLIVPGAVRINLRKKAVDEINSKQQELNDGVTYISSPEFDTNNMEGSIENYINGYGYPGDKQSPGDVVLKIGDTIMATRNEYMGNRYSISYREENNKLIYDNTAPLLINGTSGTFVVNDKGYWGIKVEKESAIYHYYFKDKLKFKNTKEKYISEEIVEEYENGFFIQYPIKLAYGLTVNKSQGQTLDKVIIDGDSMIFPNFGYVAISRAPSFKDIHLNGFHPTFFKMTPESIEIKTSVKSKAKENKEKYKDLVTEACSLISALKRID